MEQIDATVIGAGVVGLAIASELSKNHEVFVFEKNEKFGQETSSRNSEVIHAAIHYPVDSLKSRLCLRGSELIYQMNPDSVPHRKIGKLVVATKDEDVSELEKMVELGRKNGLELKWLDAEEMKKLEPDIRAITGIYSASTGIINSHKLMEYFLGIAKDNCGVDPVVYGSEIMQIEKAGNGYRLRTKSGEEFLSRIVVNSAGLHSDKVAQLVGIDAKTAGYSLKFYKGEYFSVSPRHDRKLSHLVYPAPPKVGLGIHAVLDLSGRLRLGPNAVPINEINYDVDPLHQEGFFQLAKRYLPFLEYRDLSPGMSGIRPKLQEEAGKFPDFVIKEESDKGFPGFINLIGIESPGLTASPAIAEYVNSLVEKL
ncbi:MAG TPA: NAD(P)/FAD-dependent oxidoreductase [Candidatus Omnitrophota bacterium]|nr:NAD(P)/FAD-dependent oxidoreductase [Candidatus Omnitrophota bacterium]